MKTTKNIARLAVTAGLTAALSFGGVMAPVTMAFAKDTAATTNGSVTIANVEGNHTEFDGYQIFKADVATVEGKTVVSNITWANGSVKAAVEGVIKNEEPTYKGKTAQDAADWITSKVTGTNDAYCVGPDNIAYKIAAAVDDLTDKKTTSAGVASGLEHGYWLFVTNADTIDDGEAGTSPIFTVVGSAPVEITEKTGIPTVEKKIVSDKDGEEYDAADSQIGQNVTYNLYGTIAENYDKYDNYFYEFSDQISKGLTLQDGAQVYLYGSKDAAQADLKRDHPTLNITNSFRRVDGVEDENGNKTTTWTCNDLKGISGATITKGSCIVVSYTAQINKHAVVGLNSNQEGNPNTVTLRYSYNPMTSNNPMTEKPGQTVSDTVRDYTYGLKINKVDLGTEKPLKGARFTITTKGDESNTNYKYVNADGMLSDSEVILSTDANGAIKLTGLDAGTYTVTEKHLDGYADISPFDFTIVPTMSEDGAKIDKLELSMPQTDKLIPGINDDGEGKVGDNKLEVKTGTATNDDGTFNITVGNTKQINLPLTGLNGVTFTWIAGGAVLCIGVAHLIRSRKRDDGSEE